jgi:hypothetical protein
MTSILDPRDDLLTDVTTLRVTDRVVQACFRYDIRFVHVFAVKRNACFDSQNVLCIVTYWSSSGIPEGIP